MEKEAKIIHIGNGSVYLIPIPQNASDDPLTLQDEIILRLDKENKRYLNLLKSVAKARPLIEYPSDTSEEHIGEAQAVSAMLHDIDEALIEFEKL